MGMLIYDGTSLPFDDRTLTHLQIVIVQKFSRNEAFLMSWKDSPSVGDGRSAIWLTPTMPLQFKFLGGKVPTIDRDWLELLGKSAESSTGLLITHADGKLALVGADGPYPGMVR
ncbi:ATP-dependent DNA ligase [Pseudoclavibacter sp. RFBA6]|nr:ATP-dependent DNA ligase [Pseudoclavibacter sp. RFBA6]